MASRAGAPTLSRGARLTLGTALFAFIVAIAVLLLEPKWRPYYELSTAPAPTWLPVPVAGVRANALVDTWGAERSGGRTHKGIDIFARRGTAILSPVQGIVVGIGQDRLGGNVVRI